MTAGANELGPACHTRRACLVLWPGNAKKRSALKEHAAVAAIVGLVCGINGLVMILAPFAWYGAVPGVTATGPFNAHFVRDIGCAYLVAGAALYLAGRDIGRDAAVAGAAFLVLHALVHVGDAVAGREDFHHLLVDLPGVFVLPIVAVWTLASMRKRRHRSKGEPS